MGQVASDVMAGVDVMRTSRIATVDGSDGRRARLQGSPREGPDSAPKQPFPCEREIAFNTCDCRHR